MNTLSSVAPDTAVHPYADALSTSTSLMAARNLHKWYFGVHALKGVSLEFKRGEVVGLFGDNGAGKSTLIKILSGVQPDEGEILFQGRPVRIPTPKAAMQLGSKRFISTTRSCLICRLRAICLSGGNHCCFRCSALAPGPCTHAHRRGKATAEVGLHLRSAEALRGELSGGQRQGVAIARAID